MKVDLDTIFEVLADTSYKGLSFIQKGRGQSRVDYILHTNKFTQEVELFIIDDVKARELIAKTHKLIEKVNKELVKDNFTDTYDAVGDLFEPYMAEEIEDLFLSFLRSRCLVGMFEQQ